MNKFAIIALLLSSQSAFAGEECYQVSSVKDAWSKTPEVLCVEGDMATNEFKLTMKSGLSFNETIVATFNLNLLERARCMDCNVDVYGLANPSNSTFNALAIRFDGKRDVQTMKEQGTVSIGETKLYYRSL